MVDMTDQRATPPLEAYEELGGGMTGGPTTRGELMTPLELASSQALAVFGQSRGAVRVQVLRDEARILAKLKALCAAAGDNYVYSWQTKNKDGTKGNVEGGTIKLANDLVRVYGNCDVDIRAFDQGAYTMFYARFVDLETGATMTRPFKQRNGQNIGMKDRDRAEDIVFQIGASKAIRNVVLNYLSTYRDFAIEETKKNMVEWVEKNGARAREWITEMLQEHSIPLERVEALRGRKFADWPARDVARTMMELRGIDDGLTVAEDVYPSGEKAADGSTAQPAAAKNAMDDLVARRGAGAATPGPTTTAAPGGSETTAAPAATKPPKAAKASGKPADPPATEPPTTEPPTTEAPRQPTQPPGTEAPSNADEVGALFQGTE